jgi:hypothetical protein
VSADNEEGQLYIGVIVVACVLFVGFYFLFYFFYARYYSKEEIAEHVRGAPGAVPKMMREASRRANFGGSGFTEQQARLGRQNSNALFRDQSVNIGSNEIQEFDEEADI